MRPIALLLLLGASACAHVSRPSDAARVRLGYTDNKLFAVEHHDAWPTPIGASTGLHAYGGRMVGNVCMVDLRLAADFRGSYLALRGEAGNRHAEEGGMHGSPTGWVPSPANEALPIYIEVRDHGSGGSLERAITGVIGDAAAQPDPRITVSHAIDLTLTRARVSGQVGGRQFDLKVRGDDYLGELRINDARMPFALRGVGSLWSMPAAAQGAILPLLLSCTELDKVIQVVDLRQPAPGGLPAPMQPSNAPPPVLAAPAMRAPVAPMPLPSHHSVQVTRR